MTDPNKHGQSEQLAELKKASETERLGELLETLKATREEAQKAALKALEEASKTENTTVNKLKPGRIDFNTAREKLEEVGILLGHEIEKAYTRDERLGLLDMSAFNPDADILFTQGQYRQHFMNVTFDGKDIDKVIEMVKAGKKVMTNCARGGFTPASAFKALFMNNGPSCFEDEMILDGLKNLRSIEAKDINDLENLDRRRPWEQFVAVQAAYQKAKPLELVPSITFALNELEVSNVGISATQDLLLSVRENIKYQSPVEHFIMMINQINEGLAEIVGDDVFQNLSVEDYQELLKKVFSDGTIDKFIPNRKTMARCSNYVHEKGGFPAIYYNNSHRKMEVFFANYPSVAIDRMGGCISFG